MTITIDKPPSVIAELKLDTAPHPEQHWEGRIELVESDATELNFRLVARLRLAGGLIEGEGIVTIGEAVEPAVDVSLSGEMGHESVSFTVWMNEEALVRVRFFCTGALNADATRMDGNVVSPCIDLETCNCGGATGTFDLRRIGQTS